MQSRNRIRSRRTRAFTLFEVLMVIVILGVLAAVIIPQFTSTGRRAEIDLAGTQVRSALATPLELYRTHCGRYPTSEEGLRALYEKPADEQLAQKWAGPYVKSAEIKDPWGNDLIYVCPGEYNKDTYDLSSPGPDRQPGTDDDVRNWKTV